MDSTEGSPCEPIPPKEIIKKSDSHFKEFYSVVTANNLRHTIFPVPNKQESFIDISTWYTWPKDDFEIYDKIISTFKFLDQIDDELPLLYPNLKWSSPETVIFYSGECDKFEQEINGKKFISEVVKEENYEDILLDVFSYYRQYLSKEKGWEFCLSRFSNDGEIQGWKNNNKYFFVSVDYSSSSGYAEIWHN